MRSRWIQHKGTTIFFQDFSSQNLLDVEPLRQELAEVQEIVINAPEHSVLVLADFRQTRIGFDMLEILVASSKQTNAHVKKTAVLGVTGTKRLLADIFIRLTGQSLSFFDTEEAACEWLVS